MTQEVIARLLVRIESVIFTMDPPVSLFSGAIQDPQNDLEKHSIFKPVSKAEKIRKTIPKASKNTNNRPSNHQKTIFAKTSFLQDLPYENLVLRAAAVKNSTRKSMQKVSWKQAKKNIEFSPSKPKKLSNWDPKITSK